MSSLEETLIRAAELDRADPLGPVRDMFHIPDGLVYLDGNSLGCQPRSVEARLAKAVDVEWREHLITGWNRDGWIDLPEITGNKIGELIGAAPGTVRVCDSTSVNLYKVLTAALAKQGDQGIILSDTGNFPTDLYVAQTLAARMPNVSFKMTEPEKLYDAIKQGVSVLLVTEVDYRTGRRHDMADLTRKAHEVGALVVWDLAHSAGAFSVDLTGGHADYAIGCGYKYLNGGPGAPAFLYVRPDHLPDAAPLPSGWFGHKAPFSFDLAYSPDAGIDRFKVGTPPVLSMIALDAALDVWADVDMRDVEAKSRALTSFFIECVDGFAEPCGLRLATPRDPDRRGSHVSWRHDNAYPVMQALIANGVIGDMRAPDFLRFGFTPLYTSFADVAKASGILQAILLEKSWDQPQFHNRSKVT